MGRGPARILGGMDVLFAAQNWLALALGVAALAMEIYAFVDALRYPAQAYPAAGKLTKPIWLGILGVAVLVGFVLVQNVFGLAILGVVAAGVYLVDVRPALRAVTPRKRGRRATGSGPYGSW